MSICYISYGPCTWFGPSVCYVAYCILLHSFAHGLFSLPISFGYRLYVLHRPIPRIQTIVLIILAVYIFSFLQMCNVQSVVAADSSRTKRTQGSPEASQLRTLQSPVRRRVYLHSKERRNTKKHNGIATQPPKGAPNGKTDKSGARQNGVRTQQEDTVRSYSEKHEDGNKEHITSRPPREESVPRLRRAMRP